jgi:CRP-like cAMP-binding protein
MRQRSITVHANRILSLLPPDDFAQLAPYIDVVQIHQGQALAQPHEPIEHVYFPHSGIVSFVVEMNDGHMIESAMLGRDGVMGGIQTLDGKVSLNKILVQVPGVASIISAEKMRNATASNESLRGLLAKHEQFFIAQVQQSAACNATHTVETRVCRWLSRMVDLVGPEFPITQEFLAQMIGVRRTSVSLVAGQLQERGLLTYRRGHMIIVDNEGLRQASCECYETVNSHYKKVFGIPVPAVVEAQGGRTSNIHHSHSDSHTKAAT